MLLFARVLGTLLALAPSPSPSPVQPPQIAHVFTADRADHTLTSTARTTYVVTHDQIVRYGYRTVAEAIASLPGVELWPYGAAGSSAAFGIRGSGSSQVLVAVDGMPAPGMFSNTVELGNLPLTGVDRIEVVEGGGSTLYGSGAIGGVINVITQRTAASAVTARYGSFGERALAVDTPHVQIERLVAANDYPLPGGATRSGSDYASSALHANDAWHWSAYDAVLRASLESDRAGTPGPDGFLSPTSREDDVNEDATFLLSRKSGRAAQTLQLGAGRQQIAFSCDAAADPNCTFPYPALDAETRLGAGVRATLAERSGELLYGADLSRGFVRNDSGGAVAKGTPPVADDAFAQTAAYVQRRFETPWGGAYAGIRAERDGALGGEFSPSAGFVLRAANAISVKGNAATAFRAPNAGELYFPGFGNPNLLPERAKVADLTVTDNALAGGADLTWFANWTNDLIAYDFTTSTIDQIGHASIAGFTFDVRTPPRHGIAASLNATDLYRAQNLDTQTRLANDPVVTANLRLEYAAPQPRTLDGWGVGVRIAGERGTVVHTLPLFDQPAEFASVDAYVRVRAASALFTVRGYNLGNERYAAVAGFPMPGRSFAIEASLK